MATTIRRARTEDLDALCAVLEQLPFDGPRAIDRDAARPVIEVILSSPGFEPRATGFRRYF